MSKLLNDLSAAGTKIPYQVYTLEHGIERIELRVPLKQVPLFEQEFSALTTKSKASITQLVIKVGGKVKD